MAQMIRFAIFAVSAAVAGLAFFALHSFWTWTAPLLIISVGSMLAEHAFTVSQCRTIVNLDFLVPFAPMARQWVGRQWVGEHRPAFHGQGVQPLRVPR